MNSHPARTALFAASILALSACVSSPSGQYYGGGYNNSHDSDGYYRNSPYGCHDCGTVTRIEVLPGRHAPAATGAVIGGIVGAVAAREIAKDNTDSQRRRNVATAAGAAGGAAVGHAIQNRVSAPAYNVHVRMDNGREIVVSQNEIQGIYQGSLVRVQNGRVYAR
ncbi:peptidoglycan-associated outer membrane lipoprotein precursor [Lysobacteraceae bacterium NML07-0707]|nr:peptidoglycan-associated outer membrane lipoprotein precursor [Xanthomonadaceae bacterium NML07-0707]